MIEDAELFKDIASWIEAERAIWHAVVSKVANAGVVFHHTACGRTETLGLVMDVPVRVCGKCRTALIGKRFPQRRKLFDCPFCKGEIWTSGEELPAVLTHEKMSPVCLQWRTMNWQAFLKAKLELEKE